MPPDAVRQARSLPPRSRRFARWLREARLAVHLTQEKIAEYLDVSQPTYSLWEVEGRQWMEPERMERLALTLGKPAVEVAAALGYPVHAPAASTPSLPYEEDLLNDPVALADTIARLTSRLHDLMVRERDRMTAERA